MIKVRSVPEAEASSDSGTCPESGMRLYADQGDAAMGLRAVGLHLVNCVTRPIRLEGHPKTRRGQPPTGRPAPGGGFGGRPGLAQHHPGR